MSAVILILSVVSLIFAEERLVLTGSDHAVTAHVGEEVTLNCFVDSHIPPDEVSWMKVDSDKSNILVLLFQNNETYPDSADASYQGRTEFFNTEIPKGNFSLRLKGVRTEDKGVYMCEAHSGHLSANTTVSLQGLGLSSLHILVLALCCSAIIVALVFSAVILSKGIKDVSQRALRMHYVLVFVPSILMFIAFVLWGVIEGFLGEVVTCSTLNLIRFILLFKTSLYEEKLPEMIKTIIQNAFMFEYFIVVSVLYFVIFFNVWSTEGESKAMSFMGIMYGSSLHMGIQAFFAGGGFFMEFMDFFYLFTMSYTSRTFNDSAFISMFVGVAIAILSAWIVEVIIWKRFVFMHESGFFWLCLKAYYLVRRLIISTVVFYFFYQILENNEENAGLLSVTALFHLLALSGIFDLSKVSLAETPQMVLYMYGAVGALAINATTLATELILKSRKGERTIADLRVVVLPFECIFVLSWIILWAQALWIDIGEGAKQDLATIKRYGCRQWIKGLKGDPDPHEEMTEMTHQSPPAESNIEQGSPQEPPAEAEADIHVPGDALEHTDIFSGEPDEIQSEEDPHSIVTGAESIDPLGANVNTERYGNGSAAEDVSIPSLLEDNDAVSKTLLSHGKKESETNPKESRHDSVTEHMESSPLLQEDMAKSVPHSESN